MICSVKSAQAQLIFIGAIFEIFPVNLENYAPAARDHLRRHFILDCGAKRHIGKIRVFAL
jgi:hypothetical protein